MSVPALRFRDNDGQDFPEWEEKRLGDVFTFIQTNSFSRALLNYDSGIVKNIHYGDIHTKFSSNFRIKNEDVPFINENVDISNISADCYCKEGDLVIADASEDYADIGKTIEIINTNNEKLLAGLHTYIARDLTQKMSLGFSGYLMQIESVRLQIKILATGISVLGISKGNLGKVQLKIPSLLEQTKIANFLTAVDEKISLLTQKASLLSQYKKGVMQQIFSQELRFKDDDGQEFPEWEKRKLIDLSKTFIGLVTTMTTSYVEKGVCLIRNSDIKQNKIKKIGLIKLDVNFANQHKNRMLRINDVVTVHTGDVGVSAVIDESLDGCLGFATLNTRITSELLSPHYLCWFFNSHEYLSFALSMSTGDGRCNFNLKDFDVSLIPVPHIKEQTKIANFLTAVDEKITNNQTQLNAVKQYKQGLLQQMFV